LVVVHADVVEVRILHSGWLVILENHLANLFVGSPVDLFCGLIVVSATRRTPNVILTQDERQKIDIPLGVLKQNSADLEHLKTLSIHLVDRFQGWDEARLLADAEVVQSNLFVLRNLLHSKWSVFTAGDIRIILLQVTDE